MQWDIDVGVVRFVNSQAIYVETVIIKAVQVIHIWLCADNIYWLLYFPLSPLRIMPIWRTQSEEELSA